MSLTSFSFFSPMPEYHCKRKKLDRQKLNVGGLLFRKFIIFQSINYYYNKSTKNNKRNRRY